MGISASTSVSISITTQHQHHHHIAAITTRQFFGEGTKTSALYGVKPRSCNPVVVVSDDTAEKSKLELYGILGVCVGAPIIIVVIAICYCYCSTKKNKADALLHGKRDQE